MKKFLEKLKKSFRNVEDKINEYTSGSSTQMSNPSQYYVDWAMKLMDEGYEDVAIEKLETAILMYNTNPFEECCHQGSRQLPCRLQL